MCSVVFDLDIDMEGTNQRASELCCSNLNTIPCALDGSMQHKYFVLMVGSTAAGHSSLTHSLSLKRYSKAG